eukprot:scaffold107641_cov57-Phaeocystis_antarctica.AAC.3
MGATATARAAWRPLGWSGRPRWLGCNVRRAKSGAGGRHISSACSHANTGLQPSLPPGSAPPEEGAWWDCSMNPSRGQQRCDVAEESLGEGEQEVEGEALGSDDDLDESDAADEPDEPDVTATAEAAAPTVAVAVAACAEVDLLQDHVQDPEQGDDDDDDAELLAMLN